MKKFILSLVAAFAVTSVMAQTNATSSNCKKGQKMDQTEMVEKCTQEMVTKYGLTTEQSAKLKTLNEKYMGKQCGAPKDSCGKKGQRPEKPAKSTSSSTDQTKKQKPSGGNHGGPDMTAYNTELKAILTDEQYKAYETEMANQKNNKKEKKSSK